MRIHEPPRHPSSAVFDILPDHGDEAIGDLLELMYALIDAYEEHHADALRRLREQRYRELHEHDDQLSLPLQDERREPF